MNEELNQQEESEKSETQENAERAREIREERREETVESETTVGSGAPMPDTSPPEEREEEGDEDASRAEE